MNDIPVLILCGGTGTRLREQTEFTPKPLIPIGGTPMVVHIMRWYMKYGFKSFVLALGYKQEEFKRYFREYEYTHSNLLISQGNEGRRTTLLDPLFHEKFDVALVDTGLNTEKGARIKRCLPFLKGDSFLCTYGDSISNVDIQALVDFHESHNKIVTITGVKPVPRFGEIVASGDVVKSFSEKPESNVIVNGGFFVFKKLIGGYLYDNPSCDLERGTFELLAQLDEMRVYRHGGYWGCMDTMKDLGMLEQMWNGGNAPWKTS